MPLAGGALSIFSEFKGQMKYLSFLVLAAGFIVGCAADPGTQPHDMSIAAHEAAAAHADRASQAHADRFDPSSQTNAPCGNSDGCWSSIANPTKAHDEEAQQQRALAAKHRNASAALGQAEAQACDGVSADNRDMSPFFHREDIRSAGPINEQSGPGQPATGNGEPTQLGQPRATAPRHIGAVVVFKAVPGMSAEWLQRLVDCHIARAAAVGHQMPEMDYCPLVLKGVDAKVTSVGDGFAVNIKSQDPATVAEIVKRAEALVAVSSKPATEPLKATPQGSR